MSSTIIRFPKVIRKYRRRLPRRRVVSIGFRYVGPALCQEVQEVFLKRCSQGYWELQFYFQSRVWVIERCRSETLLAAIDRLWLEQPVEIDFLQAIGWTESAEICLFPGHKE